jgi:hypothetical protein
MPRQFQHHSLSIILFLAFFVLIVAQSLVGFFNYNQDQLEHQESRVSYTAYLGSGQFLEAVMENWESEFLQLFAYLVLTAILVEKGSSQSKRLEGNDPVNGGARTEQDVPWPVRRGGLILRLYENSLSLVFLTLFLLSFGLHALGGTAEYNQEQLAHGGQAISLLQYLGTSRFWFESLQNWQSEFLVIGALTVLSIFLRQRGSPESKPVAAPHQATVRE